MGDLYLYLSLCLKGFELATSVLEVNVQSRR